MEEWKGGNTVESQEQNGRREKEQGEIKKERTGEVSRTKELSVRLHKGKEGRGAARRAEENERLGWKCRERRKRR